MQNNSQKRIYFDYAAGTPVSDAALKAMQPYFSEKYGNPSSLHLFGQEAQAAIDNAREVISQAIGADFREIVFTASATEANNIALRSAVIALKEKISKPKIIVSSIEHESILKTAEDLKKWNCEVVVIPVHENGAIDLKKLEEEIDENTVLVSMMYANNEIGVIEPIQDIAEIIKAKKKNNVPLFHVDAVQAFQFFDCDARKLGVDMMTLSSHKIYGPKGAGALYVRSGLKIDPQITGGGQEFGMRSGTENVPAIVGFAAAASEIIKKRSENAARLQELKEMLWKGIHEIYRAAEINGGEFKNGNILPNILNIYFPNHLSSDLLVRFDEAGIMASAGSACSMRSIEPSYVIQALGHSKERAKRSIRFSLGAPTTKEEVKEALSRLEQVF